MVSVLLGKKKNTRLSRYPRILRKTNEKNLTTTLDVLLFRQ